MELTEAEVKLVHWQYGMLGSFYEALFTAISRADGHNQSRLSLAFPEEVEAVIRYQTESGYWHSVLDKYNAHIKGDKDNG